MTVKHWTWIMLGLIGWALIAWLWATGPYDCTPPDESGRIACKWK